MPSIRISREHRKNLTQAKKSVTQIAKHLSDKFDVAYDWTGNTLEFKRSGVDGHIHLEKHLVNIEVNLSFFLMALQGPVEREIEKYLDQEFGDD